MSSSKWKAEPIKLLSKPTDPKQNMAGSDQGRSFSTRLVTPLGEVSWGTGYLKEIFICDASLMSKGLVTNYGERVATEWEGGT